MILAGVSEGVLDSFGERSKVLNQLGFVTHFFMLNSELSIKFILLINVKMPNCLHYNNYIVG